MRKRLTIWGVFVIWIFLILLATAGIAVVLHVLLNKLGASGDRYTPHRFYELVLFASVVLGTILSGAISKRMLNRIYELRDAMKKVSSGDFTVRIRYGRIPELNALIRDFNKMTKDLGSIQTLKDDFTTSISHEIKTPIASIEGCVELLKDRTLCEQEALEYINLIEISAKRLSVMSSNILRLSKLENQEILPDQTEFSLDEQIRQSILMLECKWSEKDINFNIYLNPTKVFASKDLLMQVWVNLIDNAIKFSEHGGTIAIELFQSDGRAHVKIKDYGDGMTQETIEHIFQKFYQGNAARSNQGNGLGLALVKRILDLSGGNIVVQSEPGKGSVFAVDLPVE